MIGSKPIHIMTPEDRQKLPKLEDLHVDLGLPAKAVTANVAVGDMVTLEQSFLDLGLVDVYRASSPDGRAYSWWDYRGGSFPRNQGLRIDFLLATPGVMARVRAVEIDREYRKKQAGLTASDHAPVYADLDWPAGTVGRGVEPETPA